MKKTQYLECQNGTWYIRKTLNPELQGYYGKKVIKHSLHTTKLSEAIAKRSALIDSINNKTYSQGVKIGDLLSNHIEEYLDDSNTRQSSKYHAKIILARFKNTIGDVRIKYVDVGLLRKYKQSLRASKLCPNTVNQHMTVTKSFLKWLIENEYVERLNYSGILKNSKLGVLSQQKTGFTDAEVLQILKYCEQFKDSKRFEWRFWLTHLYFYTGCRHRELSQITKADVKIDDYVPVIDLNVDVVDYKGEPYQKTLKNRQSIRQIPIHPTIQYYDFLEWVEKQNDGFLFGEPNGQKMTQFFSKKHKGVEGGLLAHLKIIDVKKSHDYAYNTKEKTLHSTRHTFTNKLKQQYIPYDVLEELTGHSSQHKMLDHYSQAHTLKAKYEAIKKVQYDVCFIPGLIG